MTNKPLTSQLISVAHSFRIGHEAQANQSFTDSLDMLSEYCTKLSPQQLNQISPLIEPMLLAQQRRDTLFLADIIEHELIPLVTKLHV